MMLLLEYAKDLLFPPRCIGCKQRLPLDNIKGEKSVFCIPCAAEFEKSSLAQCSECFSPMIECRCQPAVMKKAGSAALLKLTPYDSAQAHRVVATTLRSLKHTPNARAFSHFAALLAPQLEKWLAERGEKMPNSNTVVAFLPRARKRVRKLGFDQAREFAKALSHATGLSFMPILRRVRDGKAQKMLTERERRENVRGCFDLRGDVSAKRVVLVDDLVTTGAGMAEAVRLLRRAGADEVVCACMGYTLKKKRKIN